MRRTIANILLAPYWALRLLSSSKSFELNPLIGSARLNRRGLHKWRVAFAARMVAYRRRKLARNVPAEWREQFERDGFILVRNVLPEDDFRQLQKQVSDWQSARREMRQGNTITRRMAVTRDMMQAIAPLRSFLQRPDIAAAMRYVAAFDSEPLHYVQAILRRGGNRPDPQSSLHADAFHSSMKSWLFLTDVDEDGGPFTYVPGSHRLTPERLAWEQRRSIIASDPQSGELDRLSRRGSFRIEADELADLGYQQPRAIAVPANTLVIADTYGFHARGMSKPEMFRLEIWSYLRRNPFLPWTGLDLFSRPSLAPRRVHAIWRIRDRYKKWLRQPWAPAGVGRMDEGHSPQPEEV